MKKSGFQDEMRFKTASWGGDFEPVGVARNASSLYGPLDEVTTQINYARSKARRAQRRALLSMQTL